MCQATWGRARHQSERNDCPLASRFLCWLRVSPLNPKPSPCTKNKNPQAGGISRSKERHHPSDEPPPPPNDGGVLMMLLRQMAFVRRTPSSICTPNLHFRHQTLHPPEILKLHYKPSTPSRCSQSVSRIPSSASVSTNKVTLNPKL